MKLLAIYHDCDLVTYKMLEELQASGAACVTVATDAAHSAAVPPTLAVALIETIKSKFTLKAIRSLRAVMKAGAYDAVYCISTSALSTAIWASAFLPIKIIGYRGTQARVRRFDPTYYMALLNPTVDHIVCETPDIEQYLRRYIPARKLSCHTKPYALEWVAEAEANPVEYCGRELQVCFIGISKGRPHKGLAHLLDAMELLTDVPAQLTVVGEADEADVDRAAGNVTFAGTRSDALRFLPGADVLVVPSTRDASPRVVREAQACGVACVVSDIPGARDLIIPGVSGLLVPPANPQAIADALRQLADDPDRRRAMGEAGRRNIAENYRMADYVDYFKRLLKSLTA